MSYAPFVPNLLEWLQLEKLVTQLEKALSSKEPTIPEVTTQSVETTSIQMRESLLQSLVMPGSEISFALLVRTHQIAITDAINRLHDIKVSAINAQLAVGVQTFIGLLENLLDYIHRIYPQQILPLGGAA